MKESYFKAHAGGGTSDYGHSGLESAVSCFKLSCEAKINEKARETLVRTLLVSKMACSVKHKDQEHHETKAEKCYALTSDAE
jgi:hypothetical protein